MTLGCGGAPFVYEDSPCVFVRYAYTPAGVTTGATSRLTLAAAPPAATLNLGSGRMAASIPVPCLLDKWLMSRHQSTEQGPRCTTRIWEASSGRLAVDAGGVRNRAVVVTMRLTSHNG